VSATLATKGAPITFAPLGIRDPELRRERKKYAKPSSNREKPLEEAGLAIRWLIEERKLTPEIIKAFKVAVLSEKRAIVFPCYNPQGELINRSYRTLKSGKEKNVWQDKDCVAVSLWLAYARPFRLPQTSHRHLRGAH
jgi:hypothetical protein